MSATTPRTSSTERRLPGELRLGRVFLPVLPAYARNLLVGTDVAERRDDEGGLVAAGLPLFTNAVDAEVDDLDRDKGPESKLRRFLAATGGRLRPPPPAGEPFHQNLRVLGRLVGLRRVERRVLEFLLAVRMVHALEQGTDLFPGLSLEHAARLIAIALAESPEDVRRALRPRGRLVSSGLVSVTPYPDYVERRLLVSSSLPDLLMAERLRREDVLDAFAPGGSAAPAPWAELSRHVPGAELLRDLVAAAVRERRRGVNVLLHGPAGAGKSALARALASDLALDLRDIRTPTAGGHPSVDARLRVLVACDQLVRDGRSLFLFDAMEDVLEPHGPPGPGHLGARTSRAWLERRLERNAVPTIWTTADASLIDPALLGRFSLAVEVPALDERGRRDLLATLSPQGDLFDEGLAPLAERYAVAPAELAHAVETARLARRGRADAATVSAILDGSLRARGASTSAGSARPPAYRLDCLSASADVDGIAQKLSSWSRERGGVALLLHGLPGTGKTEWVHELGRRLGRPVLARRASDVESRWVGESEQNLARAFREAADRGAILLFDEVDSFLRDRRGAAWHHDVQLTNEFLQQLEAHPGIVACTTNLLDALDPAVLRRFPLKVEFRPVSPAQAAKLFAAYFGATLAPEDLAAPAPELEAALAALGPLTPGDFAAVARRTALTGEVRDVEGALRLLAEEVALRGSDAARRVGFEPPPSQRREPPRLVEAAALDPRR